MTGTTLARLTARMHKQEHLLPGPGRRRRVPEPVSAVVVGGGLAGLAAATILAERGVSVTVVEREAVLGGRVSSWGDALGGGERFEMCRGFHAFFRNYYNLRALMERVAAPDELLMPLHDYPILGPEGAVESFTGLPHTPPFNVLELSRRTPTMTAGDFLRVNLRAALDMLRFDGDATYRRYDHRTATEYLDSLRFPPRARQMLFNVFSHSFFNPEENMSAAELLMMFHFYFMANPEGLIFDVLTRPFSQALFGPLGRYVEQRGGRIVLERAAQRLAREPGGGWRVDLDRGDAVCADLAVLAVTVPALQRLVAASPDLDVLDDRDDPGWRQAIADLDVTHPFAVWRLWLDRPTRPDRAPFVGTAGLGILDNISLFHRFEDQSARWAQRTGGSVVELHAYAVPPDMDEDAMRAELLDALHALYPETAGATILDHRFLLRRDCPAFGPGSYARRPGVDTPFAGLALAGDFTRVPVPSALMERATTSGILAANHLLARWQVHPEPIWSVPTRGLLAPLATRAPRAVSRDPDPESFCARWVQKALRRTLARPSGGWYVVDASRSIADSPRGYRVAGRRLVAWRDRDAVIVAPETCPHMGAPLSEGEVCDGKIVCPWHGLALGREPYRGWRPLPSHDDGVLIWVRLGDEDATAGPVVPARPARYIDSVLRLEARCDPRDVIANRLDPWHGVHFHPHSFCRLDVLDMDDDAIVVRVVYRIVGRVGVEVDARFHCPEPRTIAMTIVAGEGQGSVVETHATPLEPGRTAITEAILATSEWPGFRLACRFGAGLIRPLLRTAAHRLWVDDAAYAERLYQLRNGAAG